MVKNMCLRICYGDRIEIEKFARPILKNDKVQNFVGR